LPHIDARADDYVVLSVEDDGSGMSEDTLGRLFEPFFTTKEPGKGTGLGMATVYGIVTRCGGSIGVYSEVGRGTSFNLYFPRADAAEMIVEAPAPPAPPRAGTQTVLVVEDQDGLRQLAKRLLQQIVSNTAPVKTPIEALTDRELTVFRLIGKGRATREIAEDLHISIKTVESYQAHIKEKLGLKNARELVQHAFQWVTREDAP